MIYKHKDRIKELIIKANGELSELESYPQSMRDEEWQCAHSKYLEYVEALHKTYRRVSVEIARRENKRSHLIVIQGGLKGE